MGNRKIKKYIPVIVSVLILLAFVVFSDPELCVFRRVTGLPCPSCGMTRSFIALFKGDIKSAFLMHPLFWLVPIIFGLLTYSYYKKVNFTKIYIAIVAIFIVVYIFRMILYFPNTYPMDYDHASLIGRIFFH
ncbi:MAG: DUF2752 domain-containing protein [Clostridiales bacterium]|nr:DUF2752 domain-containing protein [Clostridiales bacterium]